MAPAAPERDKILKFSLDKFTSEGFYKTSMDEIARELQVSKKTIYKYFPSKQKLLHAISEDLIYCVRCDIEDIIDTDESVIVKFVKIFNVYSSRLMKISDKWYRDLQLHAPEIWRNIDRLRTERIYSVMHKLLKQGKREKLIEDYPTEIIVASFVATIRAVINPEFILRNKFSIGQAFRYTFEMLMNAILTKQGREKYLKTKQLFEKEL
ncbi:MAG: TetR/AcrR family transcriptional regulator [Ignavibacteria bacterium]